MGVILLTGVIFGLCALLMIGIGIFQLKSKTPVGFYSGEKPPREDEISDLEAWNKKHGTMWVLYGIVIIASWICGCCMGDSILVLIPYTAGMILPILVMICYHHRLIKQYKIK